METDGPKYILLTPQTKEFLPIRKHIADALREDGMEELARLEEPEWRMAIQEKMMRDMGRADFIIADLTGGDPQVMYELGFAQAIRRPVIFIVQQVAKIPLKTKAFQFLTYDPGNPDALRDRIRRWVWLFQVAA